MRQYLIFYYVICLYERYTNIIYDICKENEITSFSMGIDMVIITVDM